MEAEMMAGIVKDNNLSIDEVVKKMETIDKKINFRAFGKTKPSNAKNKKPTPAPTVTEDEANKKTKKTVKHY